MVLDAVVVPTLASILGANHKLVKVSNEEIDEKLKSLRNVRDILMFIHFGRTY